MEEDVLERAKKKMVLEYASAYSNVARMRILELTGPAVSPQSSTRWTRRKLISVAKLAMARM